MSKFSFGFKIVPKDSFIKKVANLIHTSDGHNKFYNLLYRRETHKVLVVYGKIGSEGNTKIYGFNTTEEAYDFMKDKIKEKIKKGYRYHETH